MAFNEQGKHEEDMGATCDNLDTLNPYQRDDGKVCDLLQAKYMAWERLRSARAEMRALDSQLVKVGATMAELNHACW
ncbi:MAG: hypothetical protein QM820_34860 [Minicystis sp.]